MYVFTWIHLETPRNQKDKLSGLLGQTRRVSGEIHKVNIIARSVLCPVPLDSPRKTLETSTSSAQIGYVNYENDNGQNVT